MSMATAVAEPNSSVDADASIKGRVFDIQRFSIHDGPGIRTTVFMKGCPLRCAWCHNPESISMGQEISFLPDHCIGCGYCFRTCQRNAHQMIDGRHVLVRDLCAKCGQCATECYAKALEFVGRDVTAREVIDEVLRDKPFYDTSHGGMTLSGGEPALQIDFAEALLRMAREQKLHNCVETCGFCEWERLERMAAFVDLFLYDYKETDPARHREMTGVSNERILENLARLDQTGIPIILRCPIIPGVNDRDDHFEGIRRLAARLKHCNGAEIMPYHRLGESKTQRFGLDDKRRISAPTPDPNTVEEWKRKIEPYLFNA